MDEMQRRVMLEDFAFGGLFCALASLTLGFTNGSDTPHIDIFWAWPLMGAGWLIASTTRVIRCMVRDRGWAATAQQAAIFVALVGAPTLLYALAAPRLGWPHRWGFIVLVATAIIVARSGWGIFRREPK